MQTPTKIELELVGAALPGRNSTTCSTQACVFYYIFILFYFILFIDFISLIVSDMQISRQLDLELVGAALPGRKSTTCSTQAHASTHAYILHE
jgi:hypothetical protein